MCSSDLRQKQYGRAVENLSRALAVDPNYSWAYFDRGLAYQMQGRHDRAVEDLSRGKELAPNFSWTHYYLAGSYLHLGRREQAVKGMREAARLGNPEARRWLRENGLE